MALGEALFGAGVVGFVLAMVVFALLPLFAVIALRRIGSVLYALATAYLTVAKAHSSLANTADDAVDSAWPERPTARGSEVWQPVRWQPVR